MSVEWVSTTGPWDIWTPSPVFLSFSGIFTPEKEGFPCHENFVFDKKLL
jgi:hypothetical protein